jgi:NTE family protein
MAQQRKKAALALGAGAARGFAHIGVLKVFEEAGIKVDLVSGASIGAVVGAFYCSGMSLRMIERLARFTQRNHWVDLTFPRLGLICGDKLEQFIHLFIRGAAFEQLKTPLAVVATDLGSGKRVVFKSGPVARAVRASAAIPGIFVPVEQDGMTLVDGAVVERVPVQTAREMGADVVIAVDVGVYTDNVKVHHVFDVILQCIDIMARDLCRIGTTQADIVISPQLENISPGQFNKAEEAIKAGEEAARAALPAVVALLSADNRGERHA